MGCFSLQFLKACTFGSSKIKIMTVDGMSIKFEAPLLVKEVLIHHPLHSLFDSESVRVLGDGARPLHSSLPLRPGHIYFLVPHVRRPPRSPHCGCTTVSSDLSTSECTCATSDCTMPSLSCVHTALNTGLSSQSDAFPYAHVNDRSEQSDLTHTQVAKRSPGPKQQRKVSFVPTAPANVGSTKALKSCVRILPPPSDGVVRVKMVVSKRQLACVLKGGGDSISMVEGILSPLLEASKSDAAALPARVDTSTVQLSWSPSLESIPESKLSLR